MKTMKRTPRSRAKPRLLFVVDPWETLDHAKDTTLRLAEEALAHGAECFLASNRSIGLEAGIVRAEIQRISSISRPRMGGNIRREAVQWSELSKFDHIFYRTDPPVDLAYLLPLQLLASIGAKPGKRGPKIHSPPETLFFLNEKWAPAALGSLFPRSLVSTSIDRLTQFVIREGKAVLKPLYFAQSRGVEVLDAEAMPLSVVREKLRSATEKETVPVIVQQFLPGIARGETRLWYVDGKLLAAIRKIPKIGESVINMDRGGSIGIAKLSARDRGSARKVGAYLRKHGILFAAVDLIDGKVTDFNHTSPGLLVAMEELLGKNLAREALRPILK